MCLGRNRGRSMGTGAARRNGVAKRGGKAHMSGVDRRTDDLARALKKQRRASELAPEHKCEFDGLSAHASVGARASISMFKKGSPMTTGTVKWFNSQKGFGFIQPHNGGRDALVPLRAVERARPRMPS